MSRSLLISSFVLLSLLTGCGRHISSRLPGIATGTGSGAVTRDLEEKVALAIYKGEVAEMATYLDAGFPINLPLKSGLSPFLEAIVRTPPDRFEAMFRLLILKGADIALRDPSGKSAIELAAGKRVALRLLQPEKNQELLRELFSFLKDSRDRSELVAVFKEQGEDVNLVDDETGHTPLTFAISLKSRLLFAALTVDLTTSLDVNKKEKNGRTPLRFAKETGWNLAVNKLIELAAKED